MIGTLKRYVAACLLAVLAVGAWGVYYVNAPIPLPQTPTVFELKHGSSLRSVARQLTDVGVLREPWHFIVLVKLLGKESSIKAGNYELEGELTPYKLFRKITQGDVTQSEITFIEGWNFRQVRHALDQHPGIRHASAGMSEEDLLKAVGISAGSAEGMFFPDTYFFGSGMSDIEILQRAHRALQKHLSAVWAQRADGLPLNSAYDALILASIVEKETGKASERPLIAGVFLNRLRIGMRLQTDPTVIYGMGENFDGNLHRHDLLADTRYNTYTRNGLPPTPIAMPGLGSLQAAVQPASTAALYFVAKGDGSHQFSSSLPEHNRAVARYQRGPAAAAH